MVKWICAAILVVWWLFIGWMALVLATPVPPDYYGDERDYPYPHKGLIDQVDVDAQ